MGDSGVCRHLLAGRTDAFDGIEIDVWKKEWFDVICKTSARSLLLSPFENCPQGGFPLGRILDLQEPGMSISGFAS